MVFGVARIKRKYGVASLAKNPSVTGAGIKPDVNYATIFNS